MPFLVYLIDFSIWKDIRNKCMKKCVLLNTLHKVCRTTLQVLREQLLVLKAPYEYLLWTFCAPLCQILMCIKVCNWNHKARFQEKYLFWTSTPMANASDPLSRSRTREVCLDPYRARSPYNLSTSRLIFYGYGLNHALGDVGRVRLSVS